ncbi:MAG: hypothetical protein GYA17_15985 [Chloroflexi bacterium]|jgi:hypothetical protein|nr:hypothetical protein [Chloroflexota bacterium]
MTFMKPNARRLVWLAVLTALLASCTAQPVTNPDQPTPDLALVRTEAAQTVVAEITLDAVQNPSATPTQEPPTPTNTIPAASSTPTAFSTLTPLPTATKVVSSGGVAYPTITPTYYTDRAQFVTQSPASYAVFSPGADFDLRWTIKNVGARDWNTSFYYTYISGVEGSDASFYYLPGNVAINDSVELVVDMVAPTDPGNYRTTWSLINDDAVTLMTMTFIFTVQ